MSVAGELLVTTFAPLIVKVIRGTWVDALPDWKIVSKKGFGEIRWAFRQTSMVMFSVLCNGSKLLVSIAATEQWTKTWMFETLYASTKLFLHQQVCAACAAFY